MHGLMIITILLMAACHPRVKGRSSGTEAGEAPAVAGTPEPAPAKDPRPGNSTCKTLAFNATFPRLLSATGCVDPKDPTLPSAGMIPYNITAPLWSDGSDKQRFFAIPDQTFASVTSTGHVNLPVGSVTMKTFRLNGKNIETRLFMKEGETRWAGYSYEWNDAGTDAQLLESGKEKVIGNQTWVYPSSFECANCHNKAAEVTLGLSTMQLGSKLKDLEALGVLKATPEQLVPSTLLVDYRDANEPIDIRARSYLQGNCAFCHQPGGGGMGNFDLRVGRDFAVMGICNMPPMIDVFPVENPKIYRPGAPNASILYLRMKELGDFHMPPQVSRVADAAGIELMEKWILLRSSCE